MYADDTLIKDSGTTQAESIRQCQKKMEINIPVGNYEYRKTKSIIVDCNINSSAIMGSLFIEGTELQNVH